MEHNPAKAEETLSLSDDQPGNDFPPPPAPCGDLGGGGCREADEALYDMDDVPESHSALNDSLLISFSLEDARKLVAERDRLLRQYEDVNRRVQALAVLVPDHMREKVFGHRVGTSASTINLHGHGKGSIPHVPPPALDDSIVDMLDDCLEVMSQDQIEEAVWGIPDFSDKDRYTAAEIAKALEKIARRGRVTKRGMNYASKHLSRDGRELYSGPTLVQATEGLLRMAGESLEAWEVIDKLKNDADVGERVKQKPNGVYAALSRLVSRRIAYRDNTGAYVIAPK